METIRIVSEDDVVVEARRSALTPSDALKELCDGNVKEISANRVYGESLKKIVEWLEENEGKETDSRSAAELRNQPFDDWNAKFFNVDLSLLCDLVRDSDFLGIDDLSTSANKAIRLALKGKDDAEIQELMTSVQNTMKERAKKCAVKTSFSIREYAAFFFPFPLVVLGIVFLFCSFVYGFFFFPSAGGVMN